MGQIIIKDNQLWRNNTAHTSAGTWDNDASNWKKIATDTIIDPWASNTEYKLNQVVTYLGIIYKANQVHTSGSSFDSTKWTPIYANVPTWQASTQYLANQIVVYNNQLYKCTTVHTSSSTFEANATNWTPVANNIAGIPAWASGVYYYPNQVVKYDGKIWRCLTGHLSGNEEKPDYVRVYTLDNERGFFRVDQDTRAPVSYVVDMGSINNVNTLWIKGGGGYFEGECTISVSANGTDYYNVSSFHITEGADSTLHIYANIRYIKITITSFYIRGGGTGETTFYRVYAWGNSDKWEIIVDPDIKITYWATNTNYDVGNIVLYNDEFYKCIVTNNSGSSFDSSNWKKIPDIVLANWQANTAYKLNQVVVHDGKVYRCITAHTSSSTFTQANWTPINDTIDTWQTDKYYYVGQIVWYNNSLWRVTVNHKSTSTNKPDEKLVYESSSNILYTDDTTTIPISEIIDLGAVYFINKVTMTQNVNEMSVHDYMEVSEDGVNYHKWDEDGENARYIKFTNDSVTIDAGATNPYFYINNLKVYTNSSDFEEVSTMNTLTDEEIDAMFI